jgi:Tol biopolymer transport system component
MDTDLAVRPRPRLVARRQRIAFSSNRACGAADIFIVNSDGSSLRRLGGTGGSDSNPAWSPDGTKIAFDSDLGRNRDV